MSSAVYLALAISVLCVLISFAILFYNIYRSSHRVAASSLQLLIHGNSKESAKAFKTLIRHNCFLKHKLPNDAQRRDEDKYRSGYRGFISNPTNISLIYDAIKATGQAEV